MKHIALLLFLAASLAGFLPAEEPAIAATAATLESVDPLSIPSDFRSIKTVDSVVQNQGGEEVGTITALILSPSNSAEFAILSVGKFLGLAQKFVIVRSSALVSTNGRTTLLGGTRESLIALPSYPNAS